MKNKTIPYLTARFFDGISSGLFMLALPWLMLQKSNMGTFVAFTALACTLATFITAPYYAALTDRSSRKTLLVNVQMIQSITAFTVAIIYTLDQGSHWILAGAQLIFWLSSNVAWQVNNAFTQENYTKHQYAKISGYQEIVMQCTTLGAGAVGVVLLEMWGIIEFSLFAASASAIAYISYRLTPYQRQVRSVVKRSLVQQMIEVKSIYGANPMFYGFILLSCLSYPILTFLGKLVPIWFSSLKISGDWVALYQIALGLGALLSGFLVSQVLQWFQLRTIMQYSVLILASILFITASLNDPKYCVLLMLGYGFFGALNRIARTNWLHHRVQISQRGRVDGGLAMFSAATQSLSYVLIAFLAHSNNLADGFVIASSIMFLAGLVMLIIGRTMSCDNKGKTGKTTLEVRLKTT